MIKKLYNFIRSRSHLSYYILLFTKNWINPFLTIYINFKFLPFNQAIKFPIYIYSKTKFLSFKGKIILNVKEVKKGMIKIGQSNDSPCSSGGGTEITNHSIIKFNGKADIGCGCKILVYNKGEIVFGKNFRMNNQNFIGCCNNITFGEFVNIAHQTQIFDTDFHYLFNLKSKSTKNNNMPVYIGSYSWIGNRVTIMKGTKIPDYSIIASNTLLNKKYDTQEGSILAGIPAKISKENYLRIRNNSMESKLSKYFEQNENTEYKFPINIDIMKLTKY